MYSMWEETGKKAYTLCDFIFERMFRIIFRTYTSKC